MSEQDITGSPFELIRHTTDDGVDYWSGRELSKLLGYAQWRNFAGVVEDAKTACEGSGQAISDHFADASIMIPIGKGAQRKADDFHLSRYACYLVVQNADPEKSIVALGQTYFAVQTRRAELADEAALAGMTEDQQRLYIRQQLSGHNKQRAEAARCWRGEHDGLRDLPESWLPWPLRR